MSKEEFQNPETLKDAKDSLERIQEFDPEALVQERRLGENDFSDAVEPARRIIDLFSQIPVDNLTLFPNAELTKIKKQADAIYNQFNSIMSFNMNDGDVVNRRDSEVAGLWKQVQPTFSELLPLVSFIAAKTVDIPAMEKNARATVQAISDETEALLDEIRRQKDDADAILEDVRKTAAERGVSEEAYQFSTQADDHKSDAVKAEKSVLIWAAAVGAYAASSIFLHKMPFFSPESAIDSIQLVVSKVLIFVVLAAILAIKIKILLSHRHNEVVNRHRQNALMTYRSLVSAGGASETRDIVLQQAASAIYQPQDTGYVRAREASNSSITEIIPRASVPISQSQS